MSKGSRAPSTRRARLGRREFLQLTSGAALGMAGVLRASAGPPGPVAPVVSSAVDANGNFLLNGAPFLLIQATNMGYMEMKAAGYTEAEIDAKLEAMKSWGINALFGNWAQVYDGQMEQDLELWARHRFYWHGSATLDPMGDGNITNYGQPENPVIANLVNKYKSRPNLLLWWICDEYNEGFYEPSKQPLGIAIATGRRTIRNHDAAHAAGETIVLPINAWVNSPQALLPSYQVVFGEEVVAGYQSGEAFMHAYDYLHQMQPLLLGKRGAPPFCLGFSTTPVPEIDQQTNPKVVPDSRALSQVELDRYFFFQVGMNVRAFDILWGPSQRADVWNVGDAGLGPNIRGAWAHTGVALRKVVALSEAILAPGLWTPLATTPAWLPYAQLTPPPGVNKDDYSTRKSFAGVFAAKKTVGAKTYVIALNSQFRERGRAGPPGWEELAVPRATIDIGRPIRSVTRLFESGPVTFSGSLMTESLAPMQSRVYVVT